MEDQEKTRAELIEELGRLRKKLTEYETDKTIRGKVDSQVSAPLSRPADSSVGSVRPTEIPARLESHHEATQTIDLANLFTRDVTTSGSFDIRGDIWATTFGKLLQALPIPAMLIDHALNVAVANQACGRISSDYEEMLGVPFYNLFGTTVERTSVHSLLEKIFADRKPRIYESKLQIGSKETWGRITFRSVRVIKKRFLLAILEDLTVEKQQAVINTKRQDELQKEVARRRNAEENLEASLKEKEILLREIHHRVKNNLAIVNSLMRLHSKYATDEFHRQLFADAQTRIRSMSLAHETLYQSENLARLKAGEYLAVLVDHLVISIGKTGRKIELSKEIDDIFLELDTAVPLGFIVSELVSNALRHAFPAGAGGKISISLRPLVGDKLELIVKDDGIGLPKDFDPTDPQTFGFKLVNLFSDQLNGKFSISKVNGTEIRLVFNSNTNTYEDEK